MYVKFRFPSKEEVIDFVVRTTRKYLQKQPKTLIVVGAYSIGKERVYLAISQSLQVHILKHNLKKLSID
jgi:DNA cross-link repair 1A protein